MDTHNGGAQSADPPSSSAPSTRFILPAPLAPGVVFKPELITYPGPLKLYLLFGGHRWFDSDVKKGVDMATDRCSVNVQRSITQPEYDSMTDIQARTLPLSRSGLIWGLMAAVAHTAAKRNDRTALNQYKPVPRKVFGTNWFWGLKTMCTADRSIFTSWTYRFTLRTIPWTAALWYLSTLYAMAASNVEFRRDSRMQHYYEELDGLSNEELKTRQRNAVLVKIQMRTNKEAALSAQMDPTEAGWDDQASSTEPSESVYTSPSRSEYSGSYSYNYSAQSDQGNTGKSFLDDDASPVATDYQGAEPQSAWDRIRHQNQQQSQQASRQRRSAPQRMSQYDTYPTDQQESSSPASGWDRVRSQGTWVGAANDKEHERERAQEEFNRMLDAERARGEEGSGSKGGPIW
ncbi:putative endo-1,3(4)-beta-glucanase [Aspergillus stella-maris]|uniref:putative endo-1,3(4)-beta-glucanase n=1 Tax=Aspergillus stella-maris TaxID=1810926 RepID=UPI003CCD1A55